MLKILYAAANNENARLQLSRFLNECKGKPYQIKIAAYRKSSPPINIDWTLDCLQNIFKPEHITLDNEYFQLYFDQVKRFNPDLIISDLEYFTSYIANQLNITLWQCSSSLINFALTHEQKYNLGLFKKYYYIFHKIPTNHQRIINMIDNSNLNLIYSHFGDLNDALVLKDNFEWVRPYHIKAKQSLVHQHNIVAATLTNNKMIINLLQNYNDSIIFSDFCEEDYENIILKNINDYQEYTSNLANCNLFVCEGSTSLLADAFYNGKYSVVIPNVNDTESIINSVYSENMGLSKSIYKLEDISSNINIEVIPKYNDNIKYLHQRIEDL